METKKSFKSNLENFKGTFTLVGLVVSLLVLYIFITSSSKDIVIQDLQGNNTGLVEEEQVTITRQDVPPPPPPQPQQQVSADIIQVVSNDVNLKDVFNFDMDVDKDMSVDFSDVELGNNNTVEDEPEPVIFAEQMPEFPGGIDALKRYIAEHIVYPQMAQENDIQGTVYLRFVVTSKGKVGDVQIIRGVDPLLDEEAKRVVKGLPAFKPGMQGGRPVPVWYSVPIVFQLSN